MTHDELIKAILKLLVDRNYIPNKQSWQTRFAPILSERLKRNITRNTISHAMSGAPNRRGPYYREILNALYEILAEESNTNPQLEIIHDKVA